MSNQFEATLFPYGYLQDGISLTKGTARGMASILIGTEARMFEGHKGQLARLVSIRLEDDTPDGSKGRVIGICEPVVEDEPKWTPGPSEVK